MKKNVNTKSSFNAVPDETKETLVYSKLSLPRKAGILLHITSLPGKYFSGDFGQEAIEFIDFLYNSGHSVWQVLPFTPTSALTKWSPYSSESVFAGNILFISPEKLAEKSRIDTQELKSFKSKPSNRAHFSKALNCRIKLTFKAYQTFLNTQNSKDHIEFENFCHKENYWLNDYALFVLLKQRFNNSPWFHWPEEFKNRHSATLATFASENHDALMLEKFRQYLFATQWQELKNYAHQLNIEIIGDIPIYCSYNSADVWAHPHLFKLDSDKSMQVIAGVPPDYFSKSGQLWNMPTYQWLNHEKENFNWWVNRIQKNLEWFDKVRLDHFRGFASAWEVPAKASTAEKGQWVKGPGETFLSLLQKIFPDMPFIAEDLGDIDDNVYQLRDKFNLPGMEVLQFAFGKDMSDSPHIPHNHKPKNVVYTGTHDNNTIKGWYKYEINKSTKKRIQRYIACPVNNKNIHQLFIRMAWASPSQLSIVPVQDILGKGIKSRINNPGTKKNNWTWRLKSLKNLNILAVEIKKALNAYGRSRN